MMPLIITAKSDGFRRGGIAHPAEATEYQDGHFTPDALEQLKNEPMLLVQESECGLVVKTPKTEETQTANGQAPTEAALHAVFPGLPADGYRTDGVPKVDAVSAALGADVTAEQIAAAWTSYTTGDGE